MWGGSKLGLRGKQNEVMVSVQRDSSSAFLWLHEDSFLLVSLSLLIQASGKGSQAPSPHSLLSILGSSPPRSAPHSSTAENPLWPKAPAARDAVILFPLCTHAVRSSTGCFSFHQLCNTFHNYPFRNPVLLEFRAISVDPCMSFPSSR